jgi:hypothetical protein
MNRLTIGLVILGALFVRGPVLAHGGMTHVMGTVASLDADHIVVKDHAGANVSIRLTKDTKFEKGEAPAVAKDLTVGERVVVEATGKVGDLIAGEIHFGSMKSTAGHHEHE